MRTLFVYLMAIGTVALAVILGFPELFGAEPAESSSNSGRGRDGVTPVVVAVAHEASFEDTLEALGTVRANESVDITPNRADHVEVIHFDDGQEVEANALLVEMQAAEERALLAEAIAIRDDRKVVYERTLGLYEKEMIAQGELDGTKALLAASEARVISLRAAIADRQVRAPFAGTLGFRQVSVGAFLQPSTVITTLDELSVVKLDFTIPETWLAAVRKGMSIAARSDAWAGESFPGEVAMLDTRLDARTRSATVRAILPNPNRRLRPGMLMKVTVERGEAAVLQIPEEALIPYGDQQFVYRLDDQDVVAKVEVGIGRRKVGRVEVSSGLKIGDRVVVEGVVRVREGAKVRVVSIREPKS